MSPRRRPRRNRFVAGAAARLSSPLVAVLLLAPALTAWAAAWSLLKPLILTWRSLWPVAAGAGTYVLFQACFSRPMGLYVFGHELTHALAAWLSGYRVKSLKVSASGGEVVTSDTNLFVALAPYCVPLYTVVVAAAWALARRAGADLPPFWAAFGVGLTFAFHAALTLHALRQDQPDLDHGGAFLSGVLILLCNALVFALLLKFLFPQAVSLGEFGRRWWDHTRTAATSVRSAGLAAAAWAREARP